MQRENGHGGWKPPPRWKNWPKHWPCRTWNRMFQGRTGTANPSHDEDPASSLTQHPQSTIRHLRSFSAPLCDLGDLYVHSAFGFQQPAARVFREWVIKLVGGRHGRRVAFWSLGVKVHFRSGRFTGQQPREPRNRTDRFAPWALSPPRSIGSPVPFPDLISNH